MALISIGSAGNMVNQAVSALGSNAITNALGIDFGTILTPSKFLTKFTPSTVFAYRSLAYELRSAKNFDIIFHWFPKCSQIRSMFSNAFSATDTTELNLLVQSITMPSIHNEPKHANTESPHFHGSIPGNGVNGGQALTINFLNTEFSYISHCFYQWLSETESPFWIYGPSVLLSGEKNNSISNLKFLSKKGKEGDMVETITSIENGTLSKLIYLQSETEVAPFTRADIEVKYYSANMKELHSVWFMGAFPISIALENLDNKGAPEDSQSVMFTYDSVCISSPFCFSKGNGSQVTNKTINVINNAASAIGVSNSSEWTAGLYDDTLTQIGNTYLNKLSKKLNNITNKAGKKVSDKLQSWQSKLTA